MTLRVRRKRGETSRAGPGFLEVAAVRDLFHGAGDTVEYNCAGHMFHF